MTAGVGWFRISRYVVVLTFDGVAVIEMNAPDHLGGVAARAVTTTRDAMTLSRCFVRHVRVSGQQLTATITLSGAPVATRRPGRSPLAAIHSGMNPMGCPIGSDKS